MRRVIVLLASFLTLLLSGCLKAQSFELVGAARQATIVVSQQEPECVRLAIEDFVGDVHRITGKTLKVTNHPKGIKEGLVLVGSQSVKESQKWLHTYLPSADTLRGQWESYRVLASGKNLYVAGSDERGTMFALYDFAETYLGVDPFHFWTDRRPKQQPTLNWPSVSIAQKSPTFQYRGWFINDEDLLTEWVNSGAKRNIDYPYYGQVVDPSVMRHVVEALVRSRCNLIIPASFLDIRNPAEAALVKEAARRGLFVSMHHIEPLGVSAFTYFNYWKDKTGDKPPLFSYYSERAKVEEVWRVYAGEWAKYPNVIWQIGLRGIGDRPMWLADPGIPQTDADRGRLISEAMRTQMDIIRSVDKRPSPPITTTLWAEGSVLNSLGHLQIPNGVTQVFADNSPGWRWQSDFRDTKRRPEYGYGIYYHHQLWGSGPHLAQGIPPAQTQRVVSEAVDKGFTTYAIMNVSNIREFVLGTAATAQMWYDFAGFNADTFLTDWCRERFGASAAAAERAYRTYFDSFAIHDGRKVPFLLDGQSRSVGLNMLNQLKKQISQPEQYYADRRKKAVVTAESEWGRTSLGDMHPQEADSARLAEKINLQWAGLQQTGQLIQKAAVSMQPEQRQFLESNLLIHQQFMLSLTEWLANLQRAKQAENAGRWDDATFYLQQANEALALIDTAKAQATQGDKWQNWYRGEKKMNLNAVKSQTMDVLKLAQTRTPASAAAR